MRRFDGAPLIQPILFKSAIYWLYVFIVRLAERFVHFLATGGGMAGRSEICQRDRGRHDRRGGAFRRALVRRNESARLDDQLSSARARDFFFPFFLRGLFC